MKDNIFVQGCQKPIGPFSHAVVAEGQFIFVSGQGPFDPVAKKLMLGSFFEQAELTFKNIEMILSSVSLGLEDVIKTNVYISNLDNFSELNIIYKNHFSEPYPARTTIRADLLNGIDIEIDCIALLK